MSGMCEFCGKKGPFSRHGPRICRNCHLVWIHNGKPYCSICATEVLDLKEHCREKNDDKHAILEVMTS
jgi:predicted amidophosphoribosyltransferase